MKLWVAGGTGFLGSHLLRLLHHEGHEVVAVSRTGGRVDDLDVDAVDILDAEAVARSSAGCDGAFLCAGFVSRAPDDAEALHRLNVTGTRSALVGLKTAGVPRVVVASTSGTLAVSNEPGRIDDEQSGDAMRFVSSWPYYRTKFYGEQAALQCASDSLEVVVVNPSLLLGPGDLRESSTGDVRRFLDKAVAATPAGGLAFVDVRDAAAGLLSAFEKGRSGERYLLSAANMTFSALFGRLERITGIKAPLVKMPKQHELARGLFKLYERGLEAMGGSSPVDEVEMEMGQHYWYCRCDKAERELDFIARDPGETLRDTIQDLVERQVVAPRELR